MNLRNKYLANTLRILFGLFILFSGVSGLLAGNSMQGVPEAMIEPLSNLKEYGIFHMIKITEIVAGAMLILNIFPALAAIFLAPLAVGIIVFNSMMSPQYLPTGIVVVLFEIYLGYLYWDKYKVLFKK